MIGRIILVFVASLLLTVVSEAQAPAKGNSSNSLRTRVWVNLRARVYHCPGDGFYGNTVNGEFMSEGAARARGYRAVRRGACTTTSSGPAPRPSSFGPVDRVVWVNTQSRIYHCPGPSDRNFGLTERGKYMLEDAAIAAGYRAAARKKCY